jgi:hypothetical protein
MKPEKILIMMIPSSPYARTSSSNRPTIGDAWITEVTAAKAAGEHKSSPANASSVRTTASGPAAVKVGFAGRGGVWRPPADRT